MNKLVLLFHDVESHRAAASYCYCLWQQQSVQSGSSLLAFSVSDGQIDAFSVVQHHTLTVQQHHTHKTDLVTAGGNCRGLAITITTTTTSGTATTSLSNDITSSYGSPDHQHHHQQQQLCTKRAQRSAAAAIMLSMVTFQWKSLPPLPRKL